MVRKFRVTGEPIRVDSRFGVLESALRQVEGLAAVYLHGSYGTEHQTPLSDVDLALVFKAGSVPSFDVDLELRGRILEALEEDDVSITVLNAAPSPVQFHVLSTGRLLYVADAEALADFVEEVINRYGDFVIDYEAFLREYDAALVERYGGEGG